MKIFQRDQSLITRFRYVNHSYSKYENSKLENQSARGNHFPLTWGVCIRHAETMEDLKKWSKATGLINSSICIAVESLNISCR